MHTHTNNTEHQTYWPPLSYLRSSLWKPVGLLGVNANDTAPRSFSKFLRSASEHHSRISLLRADSTILWKHLDRKCARTCLAECSIRRYAASWHSTSTLYHSTLLCTLLCNMYYTALQHILPYIATHVALHCYKCYATLQHVLQYFATHTTLLCNTYYSTLQTHATLHCNTALTYTTLYCNTYYSTLQTHTTPHYNTCYATLTYATLCCDTHHARLQQILHHCPTQCMVLRTSSSISAIRCNIQVHTILYIHRRIMTKFSWWNTWYSWWWNTW